MSGALNQTILERLSQLMPRLRSEFHVKALAVFGSFSRGEESAQSDLDILVEFDGPTTLRDFMGVKFLLEDEIHRRVDLVTRKALRDALRESIEREARYVA